MFSEKVNFLNTWECLKHHDKFENKIMEINKIAEIERLKEHKK